MVQPLLGFQMLFLDSRGRSRASFLRCPTPSVRGTNSRRAVGRPILMVRSPFRSGRVRPLLLVSSPNSLYFLSQACLRMSSSGLRLVTRTFLSILMFRDEPKRRKERGLLAQRRRKQKKSSPKKIPAPEPHPRIHSTDRGTNPKKKKKKKKPLNQREVRPICLKPGRLTMRPWLRPTKRPWPRPPSMWVIPRRMYSM